jgi:RES domain-containing protein
MLIYRVGVTKHAKELSGEGAKLNGGRWNHIGVPCIYAGESRSIVLLEYSAHVSINDIKRALSFTTFFVPGDSILELKAAALPGNWKEFPHPKETRDMGSKWLQENQYLLFKIPSVIIPSEFIYLINPLHPRIKEVKIDGVEDYAYDLRVKK